MKICKLGFLLVLPLVLHLACAKGSGSDIGPATPGRVARFLRGQVVDGEGKPVVSAAVGPVGGGAPAVTGKSGRFILPHPGPGSRLLQVDGRYASADGADRFGRLRFPFTLDAGTVEMARRLVLPDLAAGAAAAVTPGVQGAQVLLDTGAVSLRISAGTEITGEGGAGSFTLSLARLGPADLPVPFSPYAGLPCTTRAVVVDPPLAAFAPAARLVLPNTLGLGPAGEADLYRLDPESGAWVFLGRGSVAGGDIQADLVPGGGLYLFAVERAQGEGTLVRGTVEDTAGDPVAGAMVQGPDGLAARSGDDGGFVLGPAAATDAAAAARTVTLAVRAGGGWMPARTVRDILLSTGGGTAAGDLELDTVPAATLQTVGVYRGYARPWRLGRGGTADFGRCGRLDGEGLLVWEDIPLGVIQLRFGWIEGEKWFQGALDGNLFRRDGVYRTRALFDDLNPRPRGVDGAFLVTAVADGGGPLPGTRVFLEGRPGGPSLVTDSFGRGWFYGRSRGQTVTVCREQELGGTTLKAVLTMQEVDNNTLTLPLPALFRSAGSDYSAFGEYDIDLQGSAGGTTGVAGRERLVDWDLRQAFLEGSDLDGTAPVRGPVVGVPAGRGTLCAWEVDGSSRLVAAACVRGLQVRAGTRSDRTLDLADLPATETLVLEGILARRNSQIAAADFRCGLGFLLPDGEALFLRRGLAPQVDGQDLRLAVPPLAGVLAGGDYLVAAEGTATADGVTRTQKALAEGAEVGQAPTLLAVPRIGSPAAGATVPSQGLKIAWTVPPETTVLRLVATWSDGAEQGKWVTWLPADVENFTYFDLPSAAFSFFPGSGVPVRFTLTAFRHEGSMLAERHPFARFMGALAWTAPTRLGVTALSSTSLELTMQ